MSAATCISCPLADHPDGGQPLPPTARRPITNRHLLTEAQAAVRAASCAACPSWKECKTCGGGLYACLHPAQENSVTDRTLRIAGLRCPLPQKPPGWEEGKPADPAAPPDTPILHATAGPDKAKKAPAGWAYGVTTVPDRLATTLPLTIDSLRNAGWPMPHLFIDGAKTATPWVSFFGLDATARWPAVRTAANWTLSLMELFMRWPWAERYAIFQDDVILGRGAREYIESSRHPTNGYLNLFTFLTNEDEIVGKAGWVEAGLKNAKHPKFPTLQTGRGAQALVFPREVALKLLELPSFLRRGQNEWRRIDGGIVDGINRLGLREWIHAPSLAQHIGDVSSMGHKRFPDARSFRGEGFDCRTLLKKKG